LLYFTNISTFAYRHNTYSRACKNIKIIFELNIANNINGIEFAKEIYNELKKLHFSNFYTLLNPSIAINDLDSYHNIKLLKEITARHNVNILATR